MGLSLRILFTWGVAVFCHMSDYPASCIDHDLCELLQGSVGVARHREGGSRDEIRDLGHGWPADAWRKFTGIFSGTDSLEKDFKIFGEQMQKFEKYVDARMRSLTEPEIFRGSHDQVADAFADLNTRASSLVQYFDKPLRTFNQGLANILPQALVLKIQATLQEVRKKGVLFAQAFGAASDSIRRANGTTVCAETVRVLAAIEAKSSDFVKAATGLQMQDIKTQFYDPQFVRLSTLPQKVRQNVEKFLKMTTDARKNLVGSLPKVVKKVRNGVASFLHLCDGIRSGIGSLGFTPSAVLLLFLAQVVS